MNIKLLLCSFLFGSYYISVHAQDKSNSDEELIVNAVIEMWDAIENGDLDRYASFVHEDYSSFGESDVYLNEGKPFELKSIGDFISRSENVHTEMHQPKVTIVGDLAWITYYWSDSGMVNGARFTSRGKSTRIFKKEGKRWLCIHAHFTSVP